MSQESMVYGWKEVRNQELSDLATRRLQAGSLSHADVDKTCRALKDPQDPDGHFDPKQLAPILQEWLDAYTLRPSALVEFGKRWGSIGLIPGAADLTESDCAAVLTGAAFKGLLSQVKSRSIEEEVRELQTADFQELDRSWREKGWLPRSEASALTAQRLEGLLAARADPSPQTLPLEELAVKDLEETVRNRKVLTIAGLLRQWSGVRTVPVQAAPLDSQPSHAPSADAGPSEEDAARKKKSPGEPALPLREAAEVARHDTVVQDYRAESDLPQDRAPECNSASTPEPALPTLDRREALVLDVLILEAVMRKSVGGNLIGLALSGGGIRSASFNLGLLQALHRNGLLKRVDYLSTVSGGGYVGSMLSSLVTQREIHMNPDCNQPLPLAADEDGRLPERVIKLVRSGSFLHNPWLHTGRYVAGLLLNNLVLLSALFAACVLIALLWRCLDIYPVADWLMEKSGGWIRDWNRPFFPAILLFAAWFAVSAVKMLLFGPRAEPPFPQVMLWTIGGCLFVGAAVWLATPNITFPVFASSSHEGLPSLISLDHIPLTVLLILALVGLLPFFRPQTFLTSGTRPAHYRKERMFFRILSLALLGGIPFFLIFLFAGHDVASNFDPSYDIRKADKDISIRRAVLHESDIYNERWDGFWSRVIKQHENNPDSPGGIIWDSVRDVQKDIKQTMKQLTAAEIKSASLPLDNKLRNKKQKIIKSINAKVLDCKCPLEQSFAHKILANPASRKVIVEQAAKMREHERLLARIAMYDQQRLLDKDIPDLNRLLLEAYFSKAIWERAVVRRAVVVERDQQFRLRLLFALAALAIVSALLVGPNATSLHGIYRSQLARIYLEPVGEEKPNDLLLRNLDTTSKGAPYHLISGALIKFPDQPRNGRPTAHYLFSHRFCGSMLTGFAPTEQYMDGTLDLATAMAISGAAFTPVRMSNRLIAVLMMIFNLRLGQWLPSPRYPSRVRRLPVLRLLLSLLRHRGPRQRRFWFVTDGGHTENLGLGPLLRRQCRLIVVSDAGHDPDYGFDDFIHLFRYARLRGVRFSALDESGFIRMDPLVPNKKTGVSKHRYVIARIDYPGPEKKKGLLIYLKPSFAGDEAPDLMRYRQTNTSFPHDPTSNQWFDADQVESYRELGSWIGERASGVLKNCLPKQHEGIGDFDSLVKSLMEELGKTQREKKLRVELQPADQPAQFDVKQPEEPLINR